MSLSPLQREAYKMFPEKTSAYNAGLAKLLSVNAAVILNQLMFWTGKGSKGEWVYKKVVDMFHETGIKKSAQETAIKLCEKFGILEITYKGVPPVRNFKVHLDKLMELVGSKRQSELRSTNGGNPSVCTDEKSSHNTESTPKKTSYSKIKDDRDSIKEGAMQLATSKTIGGDNIPAWNR